MRKELFPPLNNGLSIRTAHSYLCSNHVSNVWKAQASRVHCNNGFLIFTITWTWVKYCITTRSESSELRLGTLGRP